MHLAAVQPSAAHVVEEVPLEQEELEAPWLWCRERLADSAVHV